MKRVWKFIRPILFVLIALEIFLHFYNPFSGRVKSGNIVLPINEKYEVKNIQIQGLDADLIHTKNSLGFRGPELPDDSTIKKVICMGGSTTECFYLSDGNDWPNVLGRKLRTKDSGIWLNNAGMDGQSAYGNLVMLQQHILNLKPDYIILMCGLNDIGLDAPSKYDYNDNNWLKKAYNFLEIPATINSLIKSDKATQARLNHQYLDLQKAEQLEMNDSQILQRIAREQPLLVNYKKRLQNIIDICRDNKIKLILVSQVILFGDESDLVTNIDLGKIKIGDINGKTEGLLLKQYNKTTYELAEANHLPFINLSAQLPKDSRFFYDGFHMTNEGAEIVADKIFFEAKDLIK